MYVPSELLSGGEHKIGKCTVFDDYQNFENCAVNFWSPDIESLNDRVRLEHTIGHK